MELRHRHQPNVGPAFIKCKPIGSNTRGMIATRESIKGAETCSARMYGVTKFTSVR